MRKPAASILWSAFAHPAMKRFCLVLLPAGMALPAMAQSPPPKEQNRPNTFVLTIKTGDVKLSDDSQAISGNDWLFERRASNVAAIEVETRLKGEAGETGNLSFGGEILHYKNPFRPASSTGGGFGGTMDTTAFLARLKYYFNPGEAWQPYVGGGVGMVWSLDYEGPLHTDNGLGFQGVAGMQLRADRVGFRMEYMGLWARLPEVNSSSHGLFLGVSFFFGRGSH